MNAVGRDSDLRTLIHEGGHAFHMLAARNEPLLEYRHAPMEFCEVASMGLELLALPHFGVFYENQEDYQRAYRARFEDLVLLFPAIALGDAFQHWIHTHPRHSSRRTRPGLGGASPTASRPWSIGPATKSSELSNGTEQVFPFFCRALLLHRIWNRADWRAAGIDE